MEYSITPTLLQSFDWCENCPPSWKEKAFADLKSTLSRKPFEPTPAITAGIKLEQAVQRAVEEELTTGSEFFQKITRQCIGGKFQTWCQYYTEVEGIKTRCYGKKDVTMPGKLIDLKTTAKWDGNSDKKYRAGWQPAIYGVADKVTEFQFIVAVWESKDVFKIKDVRNVLVSGMDLDERRRAVDQRSAEFLMFLRQHNLYDTYAYTYCKNSR